MINTNHGFMANWDKGNKQRRYIYDKTAVTQSTDFRWDFYNQSIDSISFAAISLLINAGIATRLSFLVSWRFLPLNLWPILNELLIAFSQEH